MDQDACPTCEDPYVVFRDIENKRWRFLCRCEYGERCSKGRHPATHAKLNAEGGVERFACDHHGVPPEERPPAPPRFRTEEETARWIRENGRLTAEGTKIQFDRERGWCKVVLKDGREYEVTTGDALTALDAGVRWANENTATRGGADGT